MFLSLFYIALPVIVCILSLLGFGASIYAETTTDVFYTSDKVSNPPTEKHSVPEDVGKEAAWALLDEISGGGCIDSAFQSLCCLYMALTTKDVSQCVIGPLSPYTLVFLYNYYNSK